MIEVARDFVFRDIYDYAALVEACAQDMHSLFELGLEEDSKLALRLYKPHKLSLLGEYIFSMISTEQSRRYRKNSDLYEHDEAKRLERVFKEYGIALVPFCYHERSSNDIASPDDPPFYRWFLINEGAFREYWEKVTDEVFHIVFSNRRFLLQFNASLADHISAIHHRLPTEILSAEGKIKRPNRLPSWLKKATFYRDHGRCVFCRKDLSGLLAMDARLNFDHIVPLARWGSNDPSNFQLLCEKCNLRKSGLSARAGLFYVPWWDY